MAEHVDPVEAVFGALEWFCQREPDGCLALWGQISDSAGSFVTAADLALPVRDWLAAALGDGVGQVRPVRVLLAIADECRDENSDGTNHVSSLDLMARVSGLSVPQVRSLMALLRSRDVLHFAVGRVSAKGLDLVPVPSFPRRFPADREFYVLPGDAAGGYGLLWDLLDEAGFF